MSSSNESIFASPNIHHLIPIKAYLRESYIERPEMHKSKQLIIQTGLSRAVDFNFSF